MHIKQLFKKGLWAISAVCSNELFFVQLTVKAFVDIGLADIGLVGTWDASTIKEDIWSTRDIFSALKFPQDKLVTEVWLDKYIVSAMLSITILLSVFV